MADNSDNSVASVSIDLFIDTDGLKYDNTSFDGAVFDVRLGLVTEQKYDGTFTVEWLRKGIYTAEEITVNEKYISIVAYDNIAKLDVPFADIGIVFPRTLAELYGRICTYCGKRRGRVNRKSYSCRRKR